MSWDPRPVEELAYYLLMDRSFKLEEGSSSPEQLAWLAGAAAGRARIAEIGFNAGFSAMAMIAASDALVISFDLGEHVYVGAAKHFINYRYPGRHALVLGNSTQTVPRYAENARKEKLGFEPFELIFIDGGHTYEVAAADLRNCRELTYPSTAIVMDDLMPWVWWGEGPTRAWNDAIAAGEIEQIALYQNGVEVTEAKPLLGAGDRVWATGRFRP